MSYPGRTNETMVEAIVEVDAVTWPSLVPFIDAANGLVSDRCIFPDGTLPSNDRLLTVETWLAAHFYSVVDPRTTQERAGSVGEHYESKIDLRLDLTRYGQMAMMLDPSGGLARWNNNSKNQNVGQIGVLYLGTPSPWVRFDSINYNPEGS